MRAQFYILSVVIISLTIVTFAVGILEAPPSSPSPRETSFILNNLQAEAELAFSTGMRQGRVKATFEEFTQKTESELAKEMVSLKWDYTISSAKIDVSLTMKTSNTIVTDHWILS